MKNKLIKLIPIFFVLTLTSCKELPKEVNLDVLKLEENLTIHTEEQKLLLESENPSYLIENNTIKYGKRSNSKPLPISFSWEESNDLNTKPKQYILKISEYSDLSNSLEYVTNENTLDVYNLKIGTTYYYSVTSNHYGKQFESDIYSFSIEETAPRNIHVDGVENVRDIGGWDIGEGRTFKQGLIYRTAQFNYQGGLNTFVSKATEEGINTLRNELKIKTDIDLRRTVDFCDYDEVNGETSSPIGEDINYVSAPMLFGGENIFEVEKNIPSILKFFETLADIDNYPIAFHCQRGTDRTGALSYVLGALVGMSEEDLMMDYLFSNLANIKSPVFASTISGDDYYIEGIKTQEGETLSIKTKNYLIDKVGVSLNTLDTIIDILVD